MSATEKENVIIESNDTEDSIKFITAIGLFFGWLFLFFTPIAFLIGEFKGAALVRALLLGSGVALSWFLIYSQSGPGLEGVKRTATLFFSPILNMPERYRLVIMLPVFVVALSYFLFTLTWLISSDEASQKRALFASYDRATTIQWFHHGDTVDIYVYGETLSTIHDKAVGNVQKDEMVGVKITYRGDAMIKSGRDFSSMLRHDIAMARVGKTDSISGDSILGVFKTEMKPFDFVKYHGAMGITGHGSLELIVMVIYLMFGAALLAIKGKRLIRSGKVLFASAVLFVLGSSPHISSLDNLKYPQLVSVIESGQIKGSL